MSEPLLQIGGLKVSYGGIQAVKGVDLEVRSGELVAQDDHAEGDHRFAGLCGR